MELTHLRTVEEGGPMEGAGGSHGEFLGAELFHRVQCSA